MKGKWSSLVLLVCLAAFGYLFLLNPTLVSFRLLRGAPVKTNLALLVFLAFLSGFGVAFLTGLGKETVLSLRLWADRRREARRERGRRLFAQGRSLLAGQKPRAASRVLRRAYRRLPEDQAVGFDLARAEAAQGREGAAETRLKALLEDSPGNVEFLALLLDLQRRRGDREGQRTTLSGWLAADPAHLPSLRSLGELYRGEGRWSEALRVQDKVIARSEGRAERARERRVRSQWLVSAAESLPAADVRTLLERAAAEDPGYAPLALALGNTLVRLGDDEGAFRAWSKGYDATGQVGLLLQMEGLRVRQGRGDEMVKLYRKLGSKSAAAGVLRARLLLALDRAAEALDLLEPLESSRATQWLQGEALLRLRSFERAAQAFQRGTGTAGNGVPLALVCTACKASAREWRDVCPACGAGAPFELDLARLPPAAAPAA